MRWLHFRRLDFFRMLLVFHYIAKYSADNEHPAWRNALIVLAQHVPIGRLIRPTRMKKALDREFRRYKGAGSDLVGNYLGAYHEREFLPLADYGEGTEVEFEGENYIAPKNLDGYLTNLYGDYMKYPPLEKRVPKHRIVKVIFED